MTRVVILFAFFSFFKINSINCQQIIEHEYSINKEFVTIRMIDYLFVELYFFPYDSCLFSGQFNIVGDTLKLNIKAKNDSIAKAFNYPFEQSILEKVSKLKIVKNFFIPYELVAESDTLIGNYSYNDSYSFFSFRLNLDNTFNYSSSNCVSNNHVNGKWERNDNRIKLIPSKKGKQKIPIIEMTQCMNFVIMENKDNGMRSYTYFQKE